MMTYLGAAREAYCQSYLPQNVLLLEETSLFDEIWMRPLIALSTVLLSFHKHFQIRTGF